MPAQDTKITALTAIGANPINVATFPIPMVDLLDNSMAASGTTKKVTVNQILGAGGTATLASATITGAATVGTTLGVTGNLTVDTDVLAVNATTNVVSIGTTVAPAYTSKLRVEGGVEIHAAQQLNVQPGNTNPYEIVNRSAGGFDFYPTGSALGMRLAASGNLSLATGNLVMTTSGKGIDFSAVTGGTGTATGNVLNDYEEGTFTPTVTSVGGTGIVYVPDATDSGRYTKIGRLVTCQVRLAGTYTGTFTYIRVALPFSAANSDPDGAISGYNNSSGSALLGRTDYGQARFIVNNFQSSGNVGVFTVTIAV